MKTNYKTKRIQAQDLTAVKTLYKECFNLEVSKAYLEQKYNTSMFNKYTLGLIAQPENSNESAGYYGAFPLNLKVNNEVRLVAQSGDTMTSPNHRKKGLFVKLAKEVYQIAETEKLSCVFGFPNEFSYPGFKKKLDWKFYGNMNTFSKLSKVLPLCELAFKYPKLKKVYKSYLNRVLKKYKIAQSQVDLSTFNQNNYQILKDENFFNYKKNYSKSTLVKIDGFLLFINADGHLKIGDVGKFDSKRTQDFIKVIHKLSKIVKARKVIFNVNENHWLFNILNNSDFQKTEGLPVGYYEIDPELDYSKIAFSMADFDTF